MSRQGILLRAATIDDTEAVGAVLAASYSVLWQGWYPEDVLERALPHVTRANPALLASGRYFVAEEDREIVGCGGWSPDPPVGGSEVSGRAHLRHFAVHPDRNGRGIGRLLFACCAAQMLRDGRISLECMSSLPAEAFYARIGFRRLGAAAIELPGGIGIAAVHMIRGLP